MGIEAPRGMITKVKEIVMSILAWIGLGLIVGFIASKLVHKTGEGVLMNYGVRERRRNVRRRADQ